MQKFKKIFAIAFTLLMTACAAPPPAMVSPGVYVVSRTSAAGSVFANMAALKAETIEAANQFAASKGKVAVAVSMREERPVPGFPLVELQFRLVDPGAVKDSEVVLKRGPDLVIEKTENVQIKNDKLSPAKDQGKDLYTELMKLEELKKRGLLTDEEFAVQKNKLLRN